MINVNTNVHFFKLTLTDLLHRGRAVKVKFWHEKQTGIKFCRNENSFFSQHAFQVVEHDSRSFGPCPVLKRLHWSVHLSSARETASTSRLKNALVEHVFSSPKELLKLSVPSVVYAVQNNMAFIALSNLDAAVYQACTNCFILF